MIARKSHCRRRFSSLLILISWFGFYSSPFAKSSFSFLTSGEQASFLGLAKQDAKVNSLGKTQYLDDIENVIKSANSKAGKLDSTYREPVSKYKLRKLQLRAWARGQFVSFREISAATDTASALMREIGPNSKHKSLVEKIKNFKRAERPGFHGNVAELAEARARGNNTVLTKSKQSKSFDLTQRQKGPKNYQIKIYNKSGSSAAFNSVVDDILDAGKVNGKYKGGGILTSEDLKFLQDRGKVKKIGKGRYVSTKHPDMFFEDSKFFSRPGDSVTYYKKGEKSLKSRGLDDKTKEGSSKGKVSGKSAGLISKSVGLVYYGPITWSDSFIRGLKVLGWIGMAYGTGHQGYVFYKWHKGEISNREGVTITASNASALGAGFRGAYVGLKLGAKAGAGIGSLFGGGGALPGAFIGGCLGMVGGGYGAALGASNLAESAVNDYYEKLDEKQARQVEKYLYDYYATP